MSSHLTHRIKIIPISYQRPAAVGAEVFGYIDHFRVEITDPLHFIIYVWSGFSEEAGAFHYHISIHTSSLEAGDYTEYNFGDAVALYRVAIS